MRIEIGNICQLLCTIFLFLLVAHFYWGWT